MTVGEAVTAVLAEFAVGRSLTEPQTTELFDLLFNEDDLGYGWLAVTVALRARGETAAELAGICRSIESLLPAPHPTPFDVDISGTGGSPYPTLNVGTAVAFVLAGLGISVAKQGSGAVTGSLGSLDLMSEFGVSLGQMTHRVQIVRALEELNVAVFSNFLSNALPNTRLSFLTRMRSMGIRFTSAFHLVGGVPTSFPVRTRILGCTRAEDQERLAQLLRGRKAGNFAVVYGEDGFDDLSLCAPSRILVGGRERETATYVLDPSDHGLSIVRPSDVSSTDRDERIVDFLRVLSGADRGPKRTLVALNAAFAATMVRSELTLAGALALVDDCLDGRRAWSRLVQFIGVAGSAEKFFYWADRSGVG